MSIPNSKEATIGFVNDIYRPCIEKNKDIRNIQDILKSLDNGTALLNDEIKCDQYIALYGGHHFHKLYTAFGSTNFQCIEGMNLEIIDWGCGQALATCVLIDYLVENRLSPNIVSVTLVEPSLVALERGYSFTRQMLQHQFSSSTIRKVNKCIDDLTFGDLTSETDNIKVHLFSNIIDVQSFSLDNLHRLMVNSFKGLNRLICTSPDNNRRNRLDDFCNLFSQSYQVYNLVSSDEAIYKEVFYFKTRRYEERRIGRCERQFTINLAQH